MQARERDELLEQLLASLTALALAACDGGQTGATSPADAKAAGPAGDCASGDRAAGEGLVSSAREASLGEESTVCPRPRARIW